MYNVESVSVIVSTSRVEAVIRDQELLLAEIPLSGIRGLRSAVALASCDILAPGIICISTRLFALRTGERTCIRVSLASVLKKAQCFTLANLLFIRKLPSLISLDEGPRGFSARKVDVFAVRTRKLVRASLGNPNETSSRKTPGVIRWNPCREGGLNFGINRTGCNRYMRFLASALVYAHTHMHPPDRLRRDSRHCSCAPGHHPMRS